jgi:hypothetical protein
MFLDENLLVGGEFARVPPHPHERGNFTVFVGDDIDIKLRF